jgi:Helix-turn-helix domain
MSDSHICQSPFLRLSEAATFLRLDPRTLDNMRQRGTGPLYSKHGGRVVYHRDDLIVWSNEGRRRATTEKEPRPPSELGPPVPPEVTRNGRPPRE